MDLYSYKGQSPQELPDRIRLDNGETRTSLIDLSKEELIELGFEGPYSLPIFDPDTEECVWDNNLKQYDILPLQKDPSQVIEEENKKLKEFSKLFLSSEIYQKLKVLSLQKVESTFVFSELSSNISNSDLFEDYVTEFQKLFILLNLGVNSQEYKDLANLTQQSNIDTNKILPEKEFIDNYHYDFEHNLIIKKCPYNSWIIVDKSWQAPVPYPSDGNLYVWDENTLGWIKV